MKMFVELEEERKQQPAGWTLPESIELARYPDGHPDDPLAVVDELFNELAQKRNFDKWERDKLRSHLRIQAWRMVAHLVEPERKKPRDRFDELFDPEERWAQLKQKIEQLGIR